MARRLMESPRHVRRDIAELAPWFHNLHLPDGSQTAPEHPLGDFPAFKWRQLEPHLPRDMAGWRALDIGCNAGFYCIELAKRGASVVGLDIDEHFLTQARWAARQFGLEHRLEFRDTQVYDLAREPEVFDLILFMGVFYHLRYPLLALDIVSERVGGLLVFQTLTMPGSEVHGDTGDREIDDRDALHDRGWPKMAFIEDRFADDPTNWWIPNHAGVEALLRSAGLRVTARPGHELYVCRPDPSVARCARDARELHAATGRAGAAGSGRADGTQA